MSAQSSPSARSRRSYWKTTLKDNIILILRQTKKKTMLMKKRVYFAYFADVWKIQAVRVIFCPSWKIRDVL